VSWGPRDVLDADIGPAYMAIVSNGELYSALDDLKGIDQWVHLPVDPGRFASDESKDAQYTSLQILQTVWHGLEGAQVGDDEEIETERSPVTPHPG
jgi:hypothetical protein